jgi:hypothetical protein
VLTTDGTVSELRYAGSWATLVGSVTSLGKSLLGAVDMVFYWGDACLSGPGPVVSAQRSPGAQQLSCA